MQRSSPRWIGLDIGGTTLKGGAVSGATGERLAFAERPFSPSVPAGEIWRRAAELVLEVSGGATAPMRVGAGCAGLFDRASGRVLASANMPNLVGTDLVAGIERAIESAGVAGCEVVLENDANVAAFGEQWLGAGRDVLDLVLVTLGTGVGGGIVLNDELFRGPGGNAGEIGHIVIHPVPKGSEYDAKFHGELRCSCGSYGCLETLVSATAAMRRARGAGLDDDLPRLASRARAGDGPERALFHRVGRDLGAGLATLVTLFDVRTFAIGGGFGAALDVLEGGAREVLDERRYGTEPAELVPATLGSDAGWIGAARLAGRTRRDHGSALPSG